MTPETEAMLKALAPYVTLLLGAILGVMGYGALKAKVEGWDKVRQEDNKAQEASDLRLLQEVKEAKEEAAKTQERHRSDVDRALDDLRRAINGVGGRVNAMNREIGEVRATADKAVEAERHRIDVHAQRNEEQQRQNSEFYAGEAKRALERMEKLIEGKTS